MQDAKEDSKSSLQTIKKKARDWWAIHGKLWTKRFIEYIILILLVAFVVGCLFARFDLYHTDPDSARYMLSALVQTQAAIVAIVVTLTLVAVQLTASAYSPRVIRIFRDNPDMWILLLFYVFSILYGLLVLKMIQAGDLREISLFGSYLEYHIFSAYIAVAFTFFMLFPYMWNIINLLNPATIINRLAAEITPDNLLKSKEDPIQPIMDIVHGSIMRYDLATTRFGLNMLTDKIVGLIATELAADDSHKAAVKALNDRFCTPVAFAGKLAVSRDDEKSTLEAIKNLQRFAESVVTKVNDEFAVLEEAAVRAAYLLDVVGRAAAEKGLKDAAWQAAVSLKIVGHAAAEKKLEYVAVQTAVFLGALGRAAAEKGLEYAAYQAAVSLKIVGRAAADKELEDTAWQAAHSLGDVGCTAAEKELKYVAEVAADSLLSLGVATFKNGLQNAATEAAKSLAKLALVKKEIEEKAFPKFDSKLENEEDRKDFNKFTELYYKELEELRKEKEN